MELSFSELRAKEVVNTQDGKKLGRVCDVALCYPDNKWLGVVVPGSRGWKKNNLFIDLRQIVKIGEDVILVNIGTARKAPPKKGCGAACAPPSPTPFDGGFTGGGRNFEDFE